MFRRHCARFGPTHHFRQITSWSAANERIEVSDIFDEVDEDLRADRTRQLLQRYGWLLAVAAVAVIAASGAWQGWKYYQAREAARVSGIYLAAMRDAEAAAQPGAPATARVAATAGFDQVAREGAAGYRTLARLQEAALAAQAGERDQALALWDQVAADRGADPLLRDVASLHWGLTLLDTPQMDAGLAERIAGRLKPLLDPTNPFKALADEGLGLLALRQGNPDAAREIFKRLSQAVTAPQGVRGRANGLLAQIGG